MYANFSRNLGACMEDMKDTITVVIDGIEKDSANYKIRATVCKHKAVGMYCFIDSLDSARISADSCIVANGLLKKNIPLDFITPFSLFADGPLDGPMVSNDTTWQMDTVFSVSGNNFVCRTTTLVYDPDPRQQITTYSAYAKSSRICFRFEISTCTASISGDYITQLVKFTHAVLALPKR